MKKKNTVRIPGYIFVRTPFTLIHQELGLIEDQCDKLRQYTTKELTLDVNLS